MSRALLNRAARGAGFALLLGGSALLFGYPGPSAAAVSAQTSIEVPAGKTKTIRLRNLPRGAVVAVSVRSTGKLQIALISAVQLRTKKPQALFRGALERSLAFRVVVQESSDYYLVLDNRRGQAPVKTVTTISAERGSASPAAPAEKTEKAPEGPKLDQTRAALVPQA